jgi:hypothetical protein
VSDQGGITVTIPVELGENVGDAIIEAAARQLLSWTSYGPDGEEGEVPTELARRIQKAVLDEIQEQARAATPGIVATMLEEGVRRTDSWGEGPRGGPSRLGSQRAGRDPAVSR